MKNKIIIGCLGLVLAACGDSFLDLAPISNTNINSFYRTAQDMTNAVNGAYASLNTNGQYRMGMILTGEVRSDNTTIGYRAGAANVQIEVDEFRVSTTNPHVDAIWGDSYTGIARCNIVLDRIGGVEMNQVLKNQYIGESKFLRALLYFNLVRVFGPVPLVLNEVQSPEEGYNHTRNAVEEVYQQIIKDLEEADPLLPLNHPAAEVGRATKGAAKALLGKVHLTRKDFALAKAKLQEVRALNRYELLPNYADLWRPANGNHKESVFEVQYKKGGLGTGSNFANSFAPKFSSPYVLTVGAGDGFNTPTDDMEAAYETGDLRKNISMASGYTGAQGAFVPDKYVKKFLDTPFQNGDSDNNWPVLRYADVLLMLAEVLNEEAFVANGEAFTLLNQIRTRAGLAAKTATNANPQLRVANQQEFRLAIEQERRVELAFENHRWFDLVRTDRAIPVMSAKGFAINQTHLIFPIPQGQVDVNPGKILQNPGY